MTSDDTTDPRKEDMGKQPQQESESRNLGAGYEEFIQDEANLRTDSDDIERESIGTGQASDVEREGLIGDSNDVEREGIEGDDYSGVENPI